MITLGIGRATAAATPLRRRVAVAGAAGVLALGLSACQTSDEPNAARPGDTASAADPSAGVTELQPGAPGGSSTPRDPDAEVPTDAGTHADIAFTQMMVLHHRQALDMGELAVTRAGDERVRAVAARISDAQGPEILVMAGWLADWGVEIPDAEADPAEYDHAQHGHSGMVGMLTPAEMEDLAEAEGAEFDRAYLTGMIEHHEGAIEMAYDVLGDGGDARVAELATDIVASQGAEIVRLQRLLDTLEP